MNSVVLHRLGLLALLLFTGSYARAVGPASLEICNKGVVTINVVVGITADLITRQFLDVGGWNAISPGKCETVYSEDGVVSPAYIGFGVWDSQKHFGAAHIVQVPDLGWNGFSRVLTRSERRLCVRDNGMSYRIPDNPAIQCESFHYGASDPGGYRPFASALYFVPKPMECSETGFNGQVSCYGGKYYINVKPTANDTDLHASAGGKDGKDQSPDTDSPGTKILNAMGKAMQKEQQEQGQPAVCVPGELLGDWENPRPGSKMEGFKTRLKNAFAEGNLYTNATMQWYFKLGVYMYRYTPDSDLRDVMYPEPAPHECNPPGRLERLR